jgi:hypothetical protein
VSTWQNDEDLLASLKEALREAEAVPSRFIDLGKAAYVGPAHQTALPTFTYATADLTVEIDITADAVLGQLLPPQPGTVSAYPADGSIITTPVDESGSFAIRPPPASPFRLRCVTAAGLDISTGLIMA